MKPFPVFFSLVVPTRGRPDLMRAWLDSLERCTAEKKSLEVICVVDEDDPESRETLRHPDVSFVVRVVVAKAGQTMGALNRAGALRATGKWVGLANDDVIVATHGWDDILRREIGNLSDPFYLIHVNDLFFGHRLCVFPFVSKEFVKLTNGICPPDYLRYRNDDHVHAIFRMLGETLGAPRVIYFPFVHFQHLNIGKGAKGKKEYLPRHEALHEDAATYVRLHPKRIQVVEKMLRALGSETRLPSWIAQKFQEASFSERRQALFLYVPRGVEKWPAMVKLRLLRFLSHRRVVKRLFWAVRERGKELGAERRRRHRALPSP